MAEEASAADLPRPEIEDSESCVTMRFRSTQAGGACSTAPRAEEQAFRDLRGRSPDFSDRQLRRALDMLKNGGLIASTGRGLQGKWIRVSESDPRG